MRSEETYRRRWPFTRRRGWWTATGAVIHRWHAWWRRRRSHARRSPGSSHTRSRGISTISAITIRSLPTRWRGWSLLLLLLPGCSTGGSVATMRVISIISSTALCPWSRTSLVTRSIVVTAVVSASLLPRSHITGGWSTLPRLNVPVVVTLVGAGFDAARSLAIFTWSTSRQFLHELLIAVSVYIDSIDPRTRYRAYLHFTVNGITSTNGSTAAASVTTIVTPISTSLAIRTITSHVPCVAADATDDVGGEVALLRTIVLAMSDLATYGSLADLN
ncbi:hypothetical protein BDV29DRAFT_193199 [Aspergillus leporis]|uniref:Uncharacterized protein n=1 Tax=Aspergillus leporis TaxID=41062 RepID=A0A5N5WT61_9EURO|nr:hypothetical protein BDV29DRAFT_193199 [Aspergillus leporis]